MEIAAVKHLLINNQTQVNSLWLLPLTITEKGKKLTVAVRRVLISIVAGALAGALGLDGRGNNLFCRKKYASGIISHWQIRFKMVKETCSASSWAHPPPNLNSERAEHTRPPARSARVCAARGR